MFKLNYLHTVVISDIPLEWMTRLELFSSDLEQFPLMYVHFLADKIDPKIKKDSREAKERIFGFVLSGTWSNLKENGLCDVELKFVCNIKQGYSDFCDQKILEELSHRIGSANKVGFNDLKNICANSPESLSILEKIWTDKVQAVYGKFIPHGRLFEEVYGIVRFSASGNAPKLGKTSEFRMLYWYLCSLGQKVDFSGEVAHLSFIEFYLLPTYEELRLQDLTEFENFSKFFKSTKIFWNHEYTNVFTVGGFDFKSAPKSALPSKSDDFESRYSNLLSDEDYDNISRLRQIFNRMPGRLYGYIWNIMMPSSVDFKNAFASRSNFKDFYKNHSEEKGSSSKVIACFLQQSFGVEAFPIDTWVKTFIYYPLGMAPKDDGKGAPTKTLQDDLYSKYSHLDKLEKLIWVSSMGNKTNKKEFLDILWCQRYGTDQGDGGPCRGANPLSCSQCVLRKECLSYQSIKGEDIFIADDLGVLKENLCNFGLFYGVYTSGGTPRKVYVLHKNNLIERDSHSGLDIPKSVHVPVGRMNLNDFVELI